MMKFWKELKRRNVIKATLAYLVFAWLTLQVLSILLPILNAPNWALQTTTLILAIGLPIWIVISWIYDITPKGIEKTLDTSESELISQASNKRLNAFIIAGLSVAVLILSFNLIVPDSPSERELSLAVIPFKNIRVDENNEWLGPNFTQNMNTYLSKVKELLVIDSHSSGLYENTDKTNAEIGEELDVSYIIRGTLTQISDRLAITVELIDVKSNKVDWSENYDEFISVDAIKLPQELSKKIVDHLKVALNSEDKNSLQTLLTKNEEANIYFNEGVRIADLRGPHNSDSILPLSVNLFQKAIDIDPEYADAYAEIAFVSRLITEDNEVFKNLDRISFVNFYINKALELDPNNVRAYTTMAMEELGLSENFKKAKDYLDKAFQTKPNDATVHHYLGIYYKSKPEPDMFKAIEHTKMAHRLNPFSWPINANLIMYLQEANKWEEAEAAFKSSPFYAFRSYKDFSATRLLKKEVVEKKDWRVAIDYIEEEIKQDSINSFLYRELAVAYNEIEYDKESYLKYAEKAYNLGKLYSQNSDMRYMSSNGHQYFLALLQNNKFQEAEYLLNEENFRDLFSTQILILLDFYLHYYQKDYDKAETSISNWIYAKNFELLILYAKQGKLDKIDSIFRVIGPNPYYRATTYAILEERDSMYHYLSKDNIDFRHINGSVEFDSYRNEERFIELLKKNYLPITKL